MRTGMRSHLARLRYELARALIARDAAGDRQRAATLARGGTRPRDRAGPDEALARSSPVERGASQRTETRADASFALRREGDILDDRLWRSRRCGCATAAACRCSPSWSRTPVRSSTSCSSSPPPTSRATTATPARCSTTRPCRAIAGGCSICATSSRKPKASPTPAAPTARAKRSSCSRKSWRAPSASAVVRDAPATPPSAPGPTVQKRLRNAIRRIEQDLPDLGRHLDQTIRTGAFCGYLPAGRSPARGGRRRLD